MITDTDISIKDFDYPLPEEKIAQFPLEIRDASKLLIWKDGLLSENIFSQIGNPVFSVTTPRQNGNFGFHEFF